jgi:hypothetical protein
MLTLFQPSLMNQFGLSMVRRFGLAEPPYDF